MTLLQPWKATEREAILKPASTKLYICFGCLELFVWHGEQCIEFIERHVFIFEISFYEVIFWYGLFVSAGETLWPTCNFSWQRNCWTRGRSNIRAGQIFWCCFPYCWRSIRVVFSYYRALRLFYVLVTTSMNEIDKSGTLFNEYSLVSWTKAINMDLQSIPKKPYYCHWIFILEVYIGCAYLIENLFFGGCWHYKPWALD